MNSLLKNLAFSIYISYIIILIYIHITKDYSVLLPDYILQQIYTDIELDLETIQREKQRQLEISEIRKELNRLEADYVSDSAVFESILKKTRDEINNLKNT